MLVLDVGARGGLCEPFSYFDKSAITAILVEPDKDEAERLSKVKDNDSEIILPYALWDESGELTLNINKSPGHLPSLTLILKSLVNFQNVIDF